jgi:hypothetical protein
MAKGPIRMTMMKVKPMVSAPKPTAPKAKTGSTSPVRMKMPTVKPTVSAPTPKPKSKPVAKPEAKSNVPAPDMSMRAILARSERVQREEARGDEAFLRKNQPGVVRTTVNERPTPTKKGKK